MDSPLNNTSALDMDPIHDAPAVAYRVLRDEGIAACDRLRQKGNILHTLAPGPWRVFTGIAAAWKVSDVSPSRHAIVLFAGTCLRLFARHLKVLEELEVVRVVRGEAATEYRVGERLASDLAALAIERDPNLWRFAPPSHTCSAAPPSEGPMRSAAPPSEGLMRRSAPPGDDRSSAALPADVPMRRSAPPGDDRSSAAPPPGDDRSSGALPADVPMRRSAPPGDDRSSAAPPADVPMRRSAPPRRHTNASSPTQLGALLPAALPPLRPPAPAMAHAESMSRGADGAAPSSGPPFKTNKELRTSSSEEGLSHRGREEPTDADRAAACAALTALFRRLHPNRPLPQSFSHVDVAVVAECTAGTGWDPATLGEMHLDAIEGAILSSQHRAPTVRFIWGKQEHFLNHAERGEAKRRAAARRPPKPPQPIDDAPPLSLAEIARAAGGAAKALDGTASTHSSDNEQPSHPRKHAHGSSQHASLDAVPPHAGEPHDS